MVYLQKTNAIFPIHKFASNIYPNTTILTMWLYFPSRFSVIFKSLYPFCIKPYTESRFISSQSSRRKDGFGSDGICSGVTALDANQCAQIQISRGKIWGVDMAIPLNRTMFRE